MPDSGLDCVLYAGFWPWLSYMCRVHLTTVPRYDRTITRFNVQVLPKKWPKPKPQSGLDCLTCAEFASTCRSPSRCGANSARTRQSRPDSGHGLSHFPGRGFQIILTLRPEPKLENSRARTCTIAPSPASTCRLQSLCQVNSALTRQSRPVSGLNLSHLIAPSPSSASRSAAERGGNHLAEVYLSFKARIWA